jgi:hypothetical protein
VRAALGFVGAAVLIVLALLFALLASDIRSWQSTLHDDDALAATAPAAVTWSAPTHLGSAAERLLGVRDDVAARRALALYLRNAHVHARLDNARQVALERSRTEQALAGVARSSTGPRASQAETLLGVLVFNDVAPSTDPFEPTAAIDMNQAQASVADFSDAVRADPTNANAKYDLELALRLLLSQGVRVGAGQQTGAGATGRRGAGGGVPGNGY